MRENRILTGLLAEAVGFEPTSPAKDYLISSQARYDHFDTLPYLVVQKSSFDSSKTALEKCKKVMQEKAAMQYDISSKMLMIKPK